MLDDDLSAWLREQRLARGWSVAEMGRQLQQAAKATSDHTVPRAAILASYVRRWEAGKIGLTERYRLHYSTAFGIPPIHFGPHQPQAQLPEPTGRAVTDSGDMPAASLLTNRAWSRAQMRLAGLASRAVIVKPGRNTTPPI